MAENKGEAVTTIDSLMGIIKLNGKSELISLSTSLKADPGVVEKWAKILEDNGLVKITYLTGRMYIEPVSVAVDPTAMITNKVAVASAHIGHELEAQRAELERFSKMLDKVGTTAANMQSMLVKSMPPMIRENTNEINKTYDLIQEQKVKAEVIRKTATAEFNTLNSKFNEMMQRMEYLASPKLGENVDQNMAKLRESMKHVDEFRNTIDAINKNKEYAFQEMKKSLDQQLSDLNSRMGKTNSEIGERIKAYSMEMKSSISDVSAYASTAKGSMNELEKLKKEQDDIKRMLVEAKNNLSREYGRATDGIIKAEQRLKNESSLVASGMDRLREKIAQPAKLQESIDNTREELSKAKEEIAKFADDISRQKSQLDTLSASLERIASQTTAVESLLKNEMPAEMSQRIASVNAAYKTLEENKAKAEQIRSNLSKQFDESSKKLDEIVAKVDAFSSDKARADAYEKLSKVKDMSKRIDELKVALDSISKDKDSSLGQIKSNFNSQIKELNLQIEQARKQIDPQVKSYAEQMKASLQGLSKNAASASASMKKLESFKKEQEGAVRMIQDMKSKFDDRYKGVLDEMAKSEQIIEKNSADIYKVLDDIKSKMGEPIRIQDSIKAAQAQLAETRTTLNNVKNEVAQMIQQLAALKKSTNLSMGKQLEILNDILGKTATTGLEITNIKEKVADAGTSIDNITGNTKADKDDGRKKHDSDDGNGASVKHKAV